MNIRFLGTGYGLLKSKKRNTKDFRRPASLLIDNEILIDPTSEVFSFAEDYGLTGLFRDVHTVLITTIDEERFSAETLLSLLKNGKKICICAESYVRPLIPDHPLITFVEMRANEIFDVQGAKVIPIPTVYHTVNGNTAIGYALCTDRSLLYLPDGGFLHPEAWELLSKLHFDHAILGCPSADAPTGAITVRAANFEMAKMIRSIFIDAKTLSAGARCFLTAIPFDKKRSIHESLRALCDAEEGLTLAYDGLYMNV
jgi:hypothetical protein